MKLNRLGVMAVVLVVSPVLSWAQKREYIELQRTVAALQDQVRELENKQNENYGKMGALLQQALDSVTKLGRDVAVLDSTLRDREKNLAAPVVGLGSKVDQMSTEFQNLRATIEDMNGRMGKLERQIVDLTNTIKVIQAPPAAPPPQPGGQTTPGAAAGGPPIAAETLYASALRDMQTGNADMALQEFADYLRYYGQTSSAPNAQYYIGEILFNRQSYDEALKAFDAVLEVYPENSKTLDAMYMKGRTLVQMGQRNKGAEEFRAIIAKRPDSEAAARARQQLRSMGLSVNPAASKKATRRK